MSTHENRQPCTHLGNIRDVTPNAEDVCPQCVAMGDRWVHLRVCLVCGQVGCCDSSKNKHATRHHHDTGHEIIQSYEPGEGWRFCYVDDVMLPPAEPLR